MIKMYLLKNDCVIGVTDASSLNRVKINKNYVVDHDEIG